MKALVVWSLGMVLVIGCAIGEEVSEVKKPGGGTIANVGANNEQDMYTDAEAFLTLCSSWEKLSSANETMDTGKNKILSNREARQFHDGQDSFDGVGEVVYRRNIIPFLVDDGKLEYLINEKHDDLYYKTGTLSSRSSKKEVSIEDLEPIYEYLVITQKAIDCFDIKPKKSPSCIDTKFNEALPKIKKHADMTVEKTGTWKISDKSKATKDDSGGAIYFRRNEPEGSTPKKEFQQEGLEFNGVTYIYMVEDNDSNSGTGSNASDSGDCYDEMLIKILQGVNLPSSSSFTPRE